MSRTFAHRPVDADVDTAAPQRGRRTGRPSPRRTGTRAAALAAVLAEYGDL